MKEEWTLDGFELPMGHMFEVNHGLLPLKVLEIKLFHNNKSMLSTGKKLIGDKEVVMKQETKGATLLVGLDNQMEL